MNIMLLGLLGFGMGLAVPFATIGLITREGAALPEKKQLQLVRILSPLCGAGLAVLSAFRYPDTAAGLLMAIFYAVLLLASAVDWLCQTVPTQINGAILLLGLCACLLLPTPTLAQRLAGLFCVSLPLLVIAAFTGGFGGGDVKLYAASGFLLGWQATLLSLFFAVISAAVVGLVLQQRAKDKRNMRIPFVPFISLGLIIATLAGQEIVQWYWSMI